MQTCEHDRRQATCAELDACGGVFVPKALTMAIAITCANACRMSVLSERAATHAFTEISVADT